MKSLLSRIPHPASRIFSRTFVATLVATLVTLGCQSQTIPTFKSLSASNTTATSASVIFPQAPQSQIRLVSLITSSDAATGSVYIYSGTTARSVALANTNTGSATTVVVDATNGIAVGSLVYLQGSPSNVVLTVLTVPSATNFTCAAIPIAQTLNAELEVLGPPVQINAINKTNNVFASDGLFVGNYGRCVYVNITGTVLAQIVTATAHYDSTSQ